MWKNNICDLVSRNILRTKKCVYKIRFRRTIHDRDNAMLLIFWDDLHWKISPFLNEFVTLYCGKKTKWLTFQINLCSLKKRKIKITSMNGNVFRIWGMVYAIKKAWKVWNINQLKPSSEPGSKKIPSKLEVAPPPKCLLDGWRGVGDTPLDCYDY